MKTLIVPDIHLKSFMIDHVKILHDQYHFDEIVFVGDYFDDWGKLYNVNAYYNIMFELNQIKDKLPCVFLLGNHDVCYLTGETDHYSTPLVDVQLDIRNFLKDLKPQIAYETQGYLISHAGYSMEVPIEDWQFNDVSEKISLLRELDNSQTSPLWIRPNQLIQRLDFPNQIVGHTPVNTVTTLSEYGSHLVLTDTWSTASNGENVGDCSMIMIDNQKIKKIY